MWEEACSTIANQKITISVLKNEIEKLGYAITKVLSSTKGKKVLIKKVISEEDVKILQDPKIDKGDIYEDERPTKMLEQMFQHLTRESELSHEDCVFKGKVDGHAEGASNIEQPIVVQKEKLKKKKNG
ncbi:unnamed protein product [Vicia faba]|uniref:Uncharacterized protein n=1 Tax=Vicia faba TaxID=3906 RepID=A0AAV1AEB0_VICFA|nr:unnamed protein product [Vicia faba]